MINTNLLNKDVQNFINDNLKSDLTKLLLKKSPFAEVSMQEIAQQIKGKQIAEKKFPFLSKEGFIYPPHLNLEQASSQATAEYKAQFLKGKSFIDLTSGLGIDAYFLSKNFEKITLIEQNSELINLVKHNWKILGREANFINEDLKTFLKKNTKHFDTIYIDPARRDANKNKVFLLEDLSPNLIEIQCDLLKISEQIIIKLSPLIDLKYLLATIKNIYKIEIIAVKNDVKEVIIHINSKIISEKTLCKCINLESEDENFEFYFTDENNLDIDFGEPEKFLYLPNNSVLKSGAFNLIASKYHLKKIHPNTHFYTSSDKLEKFPGRILEIEICGAKDIKKGDIFNIISKNYPLKPEEIKKKYKLKDGGNQYLIFTQSQKGKIILKSK